MEEYRPVVEERDTFNVCARAFIPEENIIIYSDSLTHISADSNSLVGFTAGNLTANTALLHLMMRNR